MKAVLITFVLLLLLLTACVTGQNETQVVGSSDIHLSGNAGEIKATESGEPELFKLKFNYGDVIEISGWSSIAVAKMAKEQARSQAFMNLARVLNGIVRQKAKSTMENYGEDSLQLSERIMASMASYGADFVTSITYSDGQGNDSICTLVFDTKLVPSIYALAVDAVKREIEDEKTRLTEVTNKAIEELEESEQLTDEIREYAYSRLESQIQLLETAFKGLETEIVLETLMDFNSRIEI